MEEYIKLLDLNPEEFDLADLKKAYRKKVLQYHPDKAANEAERIGYEATMKKLNEANAYIKEYLDNHEGRYSKSEYYNTNSDSDDDTEEDTTEDTTYSDEETEEESSYEEEEENEEESEYYYEAETEEEQAEDTEEETIGLWEECVRAFKEGYNKNNSSTQPVQYSTDTKVFMVITILVIFISWLIFFHLDKEDSTPPPQQATQQKSTQNTEQQEQQTQQEQQKQNKYVVIAKDSTLGRYIADAQQKVVNNWRLPKGELPDSIRVKVAFRIGKDGDIIDYPTVKVSSGSSFVDKSCLKTVINSAPFNPIPEELNKDYLDIELNFEADKKQ